MSLTRPILFALLVLGPRLGEAQAAESLVRRYAGGYEWDALLREPPVRAELGRLLGAELAHLERNLFVSGTIDLIGGWLVVTGNAAHGGGEEEAVVCIWGDRFSVSVGILSGDTIRVFTPATTYDGVPICIKDWITQVNSGHRDRFEPAGNVRLVPRRP